MIKSLLVCVVLCVGTYAYAGESFGHCSGLFSSSESHFYSNLKVNLIKTKSGIDAIFEDGHIQTLVYGDGLAIPFQLANGRIVVGTGKDIIVFSPKDNTFEMNTWTQIYSDKSAISNWNISPNGRFVVATNTYSEHLQLVSIEIDKFLSPNYKEKRLSQININPLVLRDQVIKVVPQDDGSVVVHTVSGNISIGRVDLLASVTKINSIDEMRTQELPIEAVKMNIRNAGHVPGLVEI